MRTFWRIERGLTAVVVALGILQGLLLPTFTLASGWLASAVEGGRSITAPLTVIGVVWVLQRLLDPVAEELSGRLFRTIDEALTERVMAAMATPPGLAHVEDPVVLDAAIQAQGALSGITPGSAAEHLVLVLKRRLWGIASLAIVGAYRWWLVPLLVVPYAVAFRFFAAHNREVTMVMHGGTDRLRRAYYLRTLALTHDVAKETRVFGLAPWFVERYRTTWLAVMRDVWSARNEAWVGIVTAAVALAVAEAVGLVLLVDDAVKGAISLGVAVTTIQALLASMTLVEFANSNWVINEATITLDRLDALEVAAGDATHAIEGQRDASALPRERIRFEGVRFTYPGREEPVFDGFDLDVEIGRSLAIVGENGAGKTTFVKLLARLYDPDGGRVTIDGIDLRELDPVSWRRRIAPVFQDHVQFEVSAASNVGFGSLPIAHDRAGIEHAAALAGATAIVERLDDGWDTTLSRSFTGGTQLSGGEWQRLALARALFAVRGGAGILVLDEPTAAMDVRGEAAVYDRFLELTRGVTTIVISHRFSTVRRADRIVVVEHGRVVEDGTHEELLARGGRYATMYRLQAARFTDGEETA